MVSWRSPGLTGLGVGCGLERMRRRRGERWDLREGDGGRGRGREWRLRDQGRGSCKGLNVEQRDGGGG